MISEQEVRHIAKLARLGLSKNEIDKFKGELSAILDYVKKLEKMNISNVKPTTHPFLSENVMREDRAGKPNLKSADRLIEMAPQRKGKYVKVKSVLWI